MKKIIKYNDIDITQNVNLNLPARKKGGNQYHEIKTEIVQNGTVTYSSNVTSSPSKLIDTIKSECNCAEKFIDHNFFGTDYELLLKLGFEDESKNDIIDDVILNDIIIELNEYAENVDSYEYGLPTYDSSFNHMQNMRNIIKSKLEK